ncbi:MAG: lipocalin family protein [Nitrosospira sp.]|nr:lipocalin family protein [Nitrosospira sp.]MBI0416719.1 lipocalin family protein [Nitrosospira sp.]
MKNTFTKKIVTLFSVAGLLTLAACQGAANKPLPAVLQVDLPRFMGDWYVIANIPTFIETGAHNAIESYKLDADGTIAVTFTFRDGAFDGKLKQYKPRGFVRDTTSNAVWDMQFIWPIKADYRITYLAPDYSQTIISREQRDYVWIMARTPSIPDADYQRLANLVRDQGYDVARLQKVPQQWKK